jgi:uncharacterized protein HemX
MTIPSWAIGTIISLAMLALAVAGYIVGRRKDREGRIEREATERTEVKDALNRQSEKLDQMDRNINDKLSRIEGQQASMAGTVADHEKRLCILEYDKKLKEE